MLLCNKLFYILVCHSADQGTLLMLVDLWNSLAHCSSIVSSISALTSYNNMMADQDEEDHINDVKGLLEAVVNLKTSAAGANVEVDGVILSSDTVSLHELIRNHKLIYSVKDVPRGKFSWSGLRQLKSTKGSSNPAFKLPDNMATFYGSLDYDYALKNATGGTKVIKHDVITISPVILDAKTRNSTKSGSGVYGVDWWQVYLPIALLKKISKDIIAATGYIVGEEGVIMDYSQELASVTINCRNIEDSPNITMFEVTSEVTAGAAAEDDDDDDAPTSGDVVEKLTSNDMGTLAELMSDGGENDLIGGLGFFSIGLSCKFMAGAEPPPAGTVVKLSLKMKAFHALHIIDGGIKRISYKSKASGLKY